MNNPELYIGNNKVHHRDLESILKESVHLLQFSSTKCEKILDIGCGTGDNTWEVLRPHMPATAQIYGCDKSEKMLQYAEKHFPQLKLFKMDIGTTELPENLRSVFDHVFSSFSIHWVGDQRLVFKNIFDLLKPGGDMVHLLLATQPIFDVYIRMAKKPQWTQYFTDMYNCISPYHRDHNADRIVRTTLESTGFHVTVCELRNHEFQFENREKFYELMESVNPYIDEVALSEKANFLIDFRNEFDKLLREDNAISESGQFTLRYELVIIVANKPQE